MGKKIGEYYYQSIEYKIDTRWLKVINIRQQGKTDITFVLVCTRWLVECYVGSHQGQICSVDCG